MTYKIKVAEKESFKECSVAKTHETEQTFNDAINDLQLLLECFESNKFMTNTSPPNYSS